MKTTLFLSVFSFLSLILTPAARAEQASTEELKPMMNQNFATILELQEIAASPESFRKAANYAKIVALIDRLEGIAHVMPEVTGATRPGLSAVASVYSEYLADLKEAAKSGNPVYLRNRIRTATGFCFECHTSSATGKTFRDGGRRLDALKLTPFQKAEFLAATRQFDKAISLYQDILAKEPSVAARSTELPHAVRNALTIAVRVKQDPKLAQEILDRVHARKDLSGFFRGQIEAWKKDVGEWKREKSLDPSAPAVSWLEKARRLVDRAQTLQTYQADHAGDVSYLRAVSFAQETLARPTTPEQKAEALRILGVSHSVLEDPLLWNLDEYYLEACVTGLPHSETAKKCFDRWLQETTFGFSGSQGLDLPPDMPARIDRLRELAE
ncbi:MAG TPA: hypothetical protein VLJ37_05370 [bacterium]|nr:hypothetical protein [bacterium]